MLRVLQTEIMKLKRERMNLIVLFTAVFVPLLNVIIISNQISRAKDVSKYTLEHYFMNNTNFLAAVFGPMLVAFMAIYLFLKEYKDDTLKTLLVTPVKRSSIYFGKLVFTSLFSLAVIMLSYLTAVLLGYIARFPGFNSDVLYNSLMLHLRTALLLISFIPLTFLLTLWLKNILFALFITLMGMITGMMIAGSDYSFYFPWSAVLIINSYPKSGIGAEVWKPVISLVMNFAVFGYISFRYFLRKEI